jgi:hypothetical protein
MLPIGIGLALLASGLSGCASLYVGAALGPAPYPPTVTGYEWAGRRGDELIVVYDAWSGRPRRVETRWTALDLRAAAWSAGLEARQLGTAMTRTDPAPDRASMVPVPVTEWIPGAAPPDRRAPAGGDAVVVYARRGPAPELVVVATDPSGQVRSAAWALSVPKAPGLPEPLPRMLARAVAVPLAGVVDLVTAPVQLLLGAVGVLRLH